MNPTIFPIKFGNAGVAGDFSGSLVYWKYNSPIRAIIDGLYINVESAITYDSTIAKVTFPYWHINPYRTYCLYEVSNH